MSTLSLPTFMNNLRQDKSELTYSQRANVRDKWIRSPTLCESEQEKQGQNSKYLNE